MECFAGDDKRRKKVEASGGGGKGGRERLLWCVCRNRIEDILATHHAEEFSPNLARVGDGDAAEALFNLDLTNIPDLCIETKGEGICDEAVLEALHRLDHGRLLLNRAVVVDDADSSHKRHRNCDGRLGHGVHGRRDERAPQANVLRDARVSGHGRGGKVNVSWKHQEVVIGQARLLLDEFCESVAIIFAFGEGLLDVLWQRRLV